MLKWVPFSSEITILKSGSPRLIRTTDETTKNVSMLLLVKAGLRNKVHINRKMLQIIKTNAPECGFAKNLPKAKSGGNA